MIPIYGDILQKQIEKSSVNTIFKYCYLNYKIVVMGDVSKLYNNIQSALVNAVDGAYKFVLNNNSQPNILVVRYPVTNVSDVCDVDSIIVLKRQSSLTLLIPENNVEFKYIECIDTKPLF